MRIIKIILILALVAALLLVGFYLLRNSLIGSAIESRLSTSLGTSVEIKKTDWSPFDNTLHLSGIQIDDPKPFEANKAIEISAIYLELEDWNIFANPLVIKTIEIDGLNAFYKADLGQTNLDILMANNKKHIEENANETSGLLSINEIKLKNSKITAELIDEVKQIPVNETLRLHNSEGKQGILLAELADALLSLTMVHLSDSGLNEVSEQIKLRLHSLKERHQDVLHAITQSLQEGSNALKDLLIREAQKIGADILKEFKFLEELLKEFIKREQQPSEPEPSKP